MRVNYIILVIILLCDCKSTGLLRNCKNHYTEESSGIVTSVLNFASPSVNDMGEYVCKAGTDAIGTTIHIAVGKKNPLSFVSLVQLSLFSVHKTTTQSECF